ncbi:hypothetical protein K034_4522 [Acinetobacter baumannii 42057_3]|nr:hypothetical protein K034_4522 [Acinetobacter baumannii 42057_3]
MKINHFYIRVLIKCLNFKHLILLNINQKTFRFLSCVKQ